MHAQLDVSWRMIVSSSMSQFSPSKKFLDIFKLFSGGSQVYMIAEKNYNFRIEKLICFT